MRQLGDIARHADEIFGDLLGITGDIASRTTQAEKRLIEAKTTVAGIRISTKFGNTTRCLTGSSLSLPSSPADSDFWL